MDCIFILHFQSDTSCETNGLPLLMMLLVFELLADDDEEENVGGSGNFRFSCN